jgi:diguanylate cyclase (GGDEF)-like protein
LNIQQETSHAAGAEGPQPELLVVDDDPATLKLLSRVLGKRYSVVTVNTPRAALKRLKTERVDIIISDYVLPGMNGVDFIKATHELAPDAKRMIITGRADLETTVSSINEAQIDFFLTKPVRAEELYQAVDKLWNHRQVQMERDRLAAQNQEMIETLRGFNAELERTVEQRTKELTDVNQRMGEAMEEIEAKNRALVLLNESLNVLATVDGLTGLYNRREFHNRLTVEWDRFKRYGRPFSLIMLDIDHFKKVNDTQGHECGDTVLASLGELLRQQKRRQDVVCRYGGEEFMIILAETSLDAAFKVAEKTRQLVAENDFRCGDLKIPVHVSVGVSGAAEHRPTSDADLVKIADQGLYRAKQAGRNRTIVVEALDSERVRLSGG